MNTHYVTFILRLQLKGNGARRILGSLQQAGLQKIRYFDSPEKFQETLQELLLEVVISSDNTIRSTVEETRS